MASGIRSYGPGKFNKVIDGYVYDLSLEGFGDTVGDVSELGEVYTRIDGPMLPDVEATAKENKDKLTPEEKAFLREQRGGAIVFENDQGSVEVDFYATKKAINTAWERISDEIEELYEDQDGDESDDFEQEPDDEDY